MYAAQRKVLTMLHNHKVTVDEAEELLDAMEIRRESSTPSIPKVDLTGESESTQQLRETLDKIAATQSPVVVQGEPGTGKELIARIIHSNSERANGPFVPVNCPTSPETIESEMFGNEGEAGHSHKRGVLEISNGGTVCFDMIETLPLETQRKLHAFLENGYLTRVGGTTPVYADARVIGATHGDLQQFVDQGKFRSDLYYRLSVCMVQAPPLRERLEDLPSLVKHFVEQQAERDGKKPPKVSDAAMNLLYEYDWPENVRELSSVMSKAMVLCEGDEITPDYLQLGRHNNR